METVEDLKKQAIEHLNRIDPNGKINRNNISFYAWPQTFGSSSGPHKYVGGQMITPFTVFVFVDIFEFAMAFCCGKWKFIDRGQFKPMMNINW